MQTAPSSDHRRLLDVDAGRQIDVETVGDISCVCDGQRVAQSISNLLGNAMRHGARDMPVTDVVREIALAHGGSVDVTSDSDSGTVFSIQLPRDASAAAASAFPGMRMN